MSTVTFYTDTKSLVDDLNNLRLGKAVFLLTTPRSEYVPIVLSISEYEFEQAHAAVLIRVQKLPVS